MDPPRRPGFAGGTVKPWPGGSRGLPGPRPPRHLEWMPAAAAPAGAVAAAGGCKVVPTSQTAPTIESRCVPATCVRLAYTVSCIVSEGAKGRGGGGGRAGVEGKRPQAGAVRRACHLPRDQGTRGQKGEGREGGMPRVLLREVYAGEVKGRPRTGRQRARDRGAWEGGQGRTRENEHTRGRARPGSGSRGGEQGGRVPSRIAPHRARAGRRAEVRKRRRENRSMLNTDLMHG